MAEEYVRYFRSPTGSFGEITESRPGITPLPEGAEEISAEEYAAALQQWQAQKDAYIADLKAVDAARQQEDYQALLTAGLPEATARRLSGLRGE